MTNGVFKDLHQNLYISSHVQQIDAPFETVIPAPVFELFFTIVLKF